MELLFKAKRKDNGEWLESDSILQFNKHPVTKVAEASLWVEGTGWIEVDPKTVSQYTNEIDKNGKKIFTNHVVKVRYKTEDEELTEKKVVTFDTEQGGFVPFTWEYCCDGCNCGCYIDSVEIIGNCFDNPRLVR